MERPDERESSQSVLLAAANAGFPLEATQLARLHRAGAIGKPDLRSLGRAKGRESIYERGTAARVVRLAELAQTERRLRERAWLLWWLDGGQMSEAAREFLRTTAESLQRDLDGVRALAGGESVVIDGETITLDDIYRSAENDPLRGPLAKARARVGKQKFSSVMAFLLDLLNGNFNGFALDHVVGSSGPERDLIVQAFGLFPALTDQLAEAGPWLQGDIEGDFAVLASRLRDLSLVKGAEDPDELLNAARVEMRSFYATVAGFADAADEVFGRGAFSFRAMTQALTTPGYSDQVFAVLAWAQLRRDRGLREGMEAINAQLGVVKTLQANLATLARLRESLPATQSIISPGRIASALRDPEEAANLASELATFHAEHAEQVDRALTTG